MTTINQPKTIAVVGGANWNDSALEVDAVVDRAPSRLTDSLPITTIQCQEAWRLWDFAEHWRYRELLYMLAWRDIAVRYKQTILGAAWAILQPLAMMLVFSMFFGRIGHMPSGDYPYPIFVLAGLLPWFYFSNSISSAGQSVLGNQNLITKIYFPRLLIPIGSMIAGLLDFAISMGLLVVMMIVYGVQPGLGIIMLPVLLIALVAATIGTGVLLSALTVKYRDFRHIVPFMIQLWMFLTPTIYMNGADSFGPLQKAILPLNPVYGLIVNFRAAVLGGEFDFYALSISCSVSFLVVVTGCWYFRRVERNFADLI